MYKSGYHDPNYWKVVDQQEEENTNPLKPCMEEDCNNLSPMGWCVPCRRKEAIDHQDKIDKYKEDNQEEWEDYE